MSTFSGSRAHHAVFQAIKRGELERITVDSKCVDCGLPGSVYDHRDYNYPLRVDLVCRSCNYKRGPAIACDLPNNLENNTRIRTNMGALLLDLIATRLTEQEIVNLLSGEGVKTTQSNISRIRNGRYKNIEYKLGAAIVTLHNQICAKKGRKR